MEYPAAFKKLKPNRGIFGISESEGPTLFDGYDGEHYDRPWDGYICLTKEERRELADYMMKLWDKWGSFK